MHVLRLRAALPASFLVAVLAGCATAKNPRDPLEPLNRTIYAFNHDLDRVASFWTDDVVIRSGLGRVIQGPAAYRSALGADSVTVYRRDPDRVDVSGNDGWPLAFESGTWTGRSPRNGQPLIRGRYAAQWIKRDGRWLIRSEVFVALGCAGSGCSRPLAVP